MRNAVIAFQRLELSFAHDLFRHRKVVNGTLLEEHQGEISDDACAVLRARVIETFNFDPRAENVRDAVTQLCLEHTFHPIRQNLDGLALGRRASCRPLANVTYMDAEDTPLNEAIGRIMLIAAVRRVREPASNSIRSWYSKASRERANPPRCKFSPVLATTPTMKF